MIHVYTPIDSQDDEATVCCIFQREEENTGEFIHEEFPSLNDYFESLKDEDGCMKGNMRFDHNVHLMTALSSYSFRNTVIVQIETILNNKVMRDAVISLFEENPLNYIEIG